MSCPVNSFTRSWGVLLPHGSLPCAESRKHLGQILGTDIEVLAYPSPEHRCRDVSITAFLLGLVEDVQDHSLLASQAVADIGQCRYGGQIIPPDLALAGC